ncbi:hypothetical protein L198_05647 [Cryptococcus wingfieldii CBS 7118]|uniref:Uncharacterized protein n=1 Tax=Cryptococcus wingfieldii CBS 7118 TaxID=1295528 RepID=A0A1E3IW55_9TREE|nr:hypothetical protein L198_05647 [Cryptococcus wingfieldii CBS 7118]ODN92850.1 hypothetical protein L198_05647 [Cryptococcus wingfieldii CBS 7118]
MENYDNDTDMSFYGNSADGQRYDPTYNYGESSAAAGGSSFAFDDFSYMTGEASNVMDPYSQQQQSSFGAASGGTASKSTKTAASINKSKGRAIVSEEEKEARKKARYETSLDRSPEARKQRRKTNVARYNAKKATSEKTRLTTLESAVRDAEARFNNTEAERQHLLTLYAQVQEENTRLKSEAEYFTEDMPWADVEFGQEDLEEMGGLL